MRLIGMLAVVAGALVLASACSGGGTPPPENEAPVADFTVPGCTIGVACDFSSKSSDDVAVTKWSWDFDGDETADANSATAAFTYGTSGTYDISLTVWDEPGLSHTKTSPITIAAGNAAPVANFEVPPCTINVACDFVSSSSDDVAVTQWSWDFNGDGTADATTAAAAFTFGTAGTFDVSLTVRDAEGLSHTKTSAITIAPPENRAPVANFEVPPCTINLACAFASTSTDDVAVTEWSWDFNGDRKADATTASASFTYTTAGTFDISLTVRDASGLSHTRTRPISIQPAPTNTSLTAGFTHECTDGVCRFTSTSTAVPPATIAAFAWNFGDFGTANVMNPKHTYAITAPADFIVTLTVTDDQGATDVESKTIAVAPPPPLAEGCTTKVFTDRNIVDCAFPVPTKSTMKIKLLAINCDLEGQRVVAPPPIGDQMFLAVCEKTVGQEIGIFGGPMDELIVYEAGSQVVIRFFQGFPDKRHPVLEPPSATFEGTFPDWTIHFEDGSQPGQPGEPDFADLVVGVRATVRP